MKMYNTAMNHDEIDWEHEDSLPGKRIYCIRVECADLDLAKRRGIRLAPAIRNFIKTLLYTNVSTKKDKLKWKITKV